MHRRPSTLRKKQPMQPRMAHLRTTDPRTTHQHSRTAHLRTALDVGNALWTQFPQFDTTAAHQLYRALLAPVEAGWQEATSLVIVPHRALRQLPFALLVTSPAAVAADHDVPFGGYTSVPWLLRKAAITQLPSVNALVTLRAHRPPQASRARRGHPP